MSEKPKTDWIDVTLEIFFILCVYVGCFLFLCAVLEYHRDPLNIIVVPIDFDRFR